MSKPLPKIILFGDSLTAWSFDTTHGKGFGDVLTDYFEGRAKVENEGWPGQTSQGLKKTFSKVITTPFTTPPLLFTIFLGANDAVLLPYVNVPIDQFTTNLLDFVTDILATESMSTTKILLITPPPIDVQEEIPDSAEHLKLNGDELEKWEKDFEEQCRKDAGFKTWLNKLKYAEAVVRLGKECQEIGSAGEGRIAVVDFWRALTNHGLSSEGRETLNEGEVDTMVNGRWPGSGLPGAKEFQKGIFTDRLHLGALGYRILSAEIMKVLGEKWPEML